MAVIIVPQIAKSENKCHDRAFHPEIWLIYTPVSFTRLLTANRRMKISWAHESGTSGDECPVLLDGMTCPACRGEYVVFVFFEYYYRSYRSINYDLQSPPAIRIIFIIRHLVNVFFFILNIFDNIPCPLLIYIGEDFL